MESEDKPNGIAEHQEANYYTFSQISNIACARSEPWYGEARPNIIVWPV